MRKNDAGLTILEIGDVIRKGKGKVLYTVTWVPEAHLYGVVQIEVQSHNTGCLSRTNVETAVLVSNIRETSPDEFSPIANDSHKVDTSGGVEPSSVQEDITKFMQENNMELEIPGEEPVVETSSYAKAVLFALNKLQKHVYGGTVRKNVKAKRRALNGRQKTSRKANR